MSPRPWFLSMAGDQHIGCPDPACSTSLGLTQEGMQIALAQQLKCRTHGLPLVPQDKPEKRR